MHAVHLSGGPGPGRTGTAAGDPPMALPQGGAAAFTHGKANALPSPLDETDSSHPNTYFIKKHGFSLSNSLGF